MSLDILIGLFWVPMILLALYAAWRVTIENRKLNQRIDELEESFERLLAVIDDVIDILACAHTGSHAALEALQAHLDGKDVELRVHTMPLRTTDVEEAPREQ